MSLLYFFSLLLSPTLSVSQTASPLSPPPDSTFFQPTGDFLFIVVTTILALRSHTLWSESRILSKLRNRSRAQQLAAAESNDPLVRFAQVYASFSKGRQRIHNRIYEPLYFILLFGMDLFRENKDYDFDTNEYLALRVVAYVGFFTVLIARGFSWKEALMAFCTVTGYLIYTGMFLYGIWGEDERFDAIRVHIERIRWVLIAFHLLFDVWYFFSAVFGVDDEISGVVRVVEKSIRARNEEGIQSSYELWSGSVQNCRMTYMRELSRNPNIAIVGTKRGPYWKLPYWAMYEIFSLLVLGLTNGFVWGKQEDFSLVPRILGIEVLEMMSWVLYLVNRTQVEPSLFVFLIKLAYDDDCREEEMETNEEEECDHVWCAMKQKPDIRNLRGKVEKLMRIPNSCSKSSNKNVDSEDV